VHRAVSEDASAVAGVVDRPRLYRILDSPLVRVCVVQGPSGSGKTTLLRSWALRDERDHVVTWVSLGPGVTSRHAFWQHVAASAKRMGGLSESAAVVAQLNAAADPVRLAIELLADAGPVTIVLDAYEHLGEARDEIDRDLARLVTAVPGLRILVTTRSGTALSDLDPHGGIVRVITLSELALTAEEVGRLIAAQTGIHDIRLARQVTASTKGFALTVRAVVLALSQLGRIPRPDSMEWDAVVAARLESLLPDPVAVRFVTDTSVAPYIDVELAEQLSGRTEAALLLDMLERNGFGRWIPYARRHPVFQYVETIRDTFRSRAGDDPVGFRRLCAQTARWLFEHDDIDQALQLAIDGGDFAFADRVFVSLVIGNPDSYITDRFLPALRRVPAEALSAHPMLAFGLGLALAANPSQRLEAPRAFRIAIESAADASYLEPDIDTFSLDAMRAVARRLAFEFPQSAQASAEAARSVEKLGADRLTRYGEHLGTILRQLSYSLLLGGRIDEAVAVSDRSVALCHSQTARNYSIVYGAGISAFAGDVSQSQRLLASVDGEAWPDALKRTYLNGLGVVAEGFARLDALDFAGALAVLHDTDCYTPTTEFWPLLTAISVAARHGLGQAGAEAERVARELAGARPPAFGDNVATEHLHAVLARAWLAAGDLRCATGLLAAQPADRAHLAAARICRLLAEGRDREAFALADAALELPGHTLRTRADVWTAGAAAALRLGQLDRAGSWLSGAAVTWEDYGARLHVALLSARDRRLLREFADERDAGSVLRYLDIPAVSRQANTAPPVSLTPRERVVLAAVAEHDSIRAVAQALVVSPHTVKSQLQGVYRKLGVSSRYAAVAVARELGLVDDPARD